MPASRQLTSALTKHLTPLSLLAILLITAAAILTSTQLFLLDLPLGGTAALLAGGALVFLTWKVHGTAVGVKELQRAVRSLTGNPQPPALSPPPAPSSPPARETLEQPDSRHSPSTMEPCADVEHAHRLFALMHGGARGRRRIALVGSSELSAHLAPHGSVVALHPRISAAEIRQADVDTLIVEEDAIDSGPWIGALDPHGASLLAELRGAVQWMQEKDAAVYVIPAAGTRKAGAQTLRLNTVVLNDTTLEAGTGDAAPSLLSTLAAHSRRQEST